MELRTGGSSGILEQGSARSTKQTSTLQGNENQRKTQTKLTKGGYGNDNKKENDKKEVKRQQKCRREKRTNGTAKSIEEKV